MRLEDILTQIAPAEQRAMAGGEAPVGCRRSPAEQPGHVETDVIGSPEHRKPLT